MAFQHILRRLCVQHYMTTFLPLFCSDDVTVGSPTEVKFRSELKKLQEQYPDHILFIQSVKHLFYLQLVVYFVL